MTSARASEISGETFVGQVCLVLLPHAVGISSSGSTLASLLGCWPVLFTQTLAMSRAEWLESDPGTSGFYGWVVIRESQPYLVLLHNLSPSSVGRWRKISPLIWIITTFNTREHRHRIGGGGFHPVVCATAACKEVIARPGDVIPCDDAEQNAVAEIITLFLIGIGMAELWL